MSIPAIKVFKNGEVVSSAVGVQSREKLLEMIGE
jgi:thioredoxin-like negative regulator of GroEL